MLYPEIEHIFLFDVHFVFYNNKETDSEFCGKFYFYYIIHKT